MRPDPSVAADPVGGAIRVGRMRVPASPSGNAGELRIGGDGGAVLRPLRFGERTAVVLAAAAQPRADEAVAAAVLAAATVRAGACDRLLLETIALWMAGAASAAPSFPETALLVGRAGNWALQDLLAAPAEDVDRLAMHLTEQQRGGEWKTLIFQPAAEDDAYLIRKRFAEQLLRRSAGGDVVAKRSGDVAVHEAGRRTAAPGRPAEREREDHLHPDAMTEEGLKSSSLGSFEPPTDLHRVDFSETTVAPAKRESASPAASLASRRSVDPAASSMDAGNVFPQHLAPSPRATRRGDSNAVPVAVDEDFEASEPSVRARGEYATAPGPDETRAALHMPEWQSVASSESAPPSPQQQANSPIEIVNAASHTAATRELATAAQRTASMETGSRESVARATASLEPVTAETVAHETARTFALPRLFVTERTRVLHDPSVSFRVRSGNPLPIDAAPDERDLARQLAQLLDDESDLRGVEP